MPKYEIAFILLICVIGYGYSFSCHTCTSKTSSGCIYGTIQKYDLKDCVSGQDRCFRATFRRGDRWAAVDYERGCADQDFCRLERNKQNATYDVVKCELCDTSGCNSGSLNY